MQTGDPARPPDLSSAQPHRPRPGRLTPLRISVTAEILAADVTTGRSLDARHALSGAELLGETEMRTSHAERRRMGQDTDSGEKGTFIFTVVQCEPSFRQSRPQSLRVSA